MPGSSALESPCDAAVRETFEETGLKVKLIDVLGFVPGRNTTAVYFIAKRLSGDPHYAQFETESLKLVPLTALLSEFSKNTNKKLAQILVPQLVSYLADNNNTDHLSEMRPLQSALRIARAAPEDIICIDDQDLLSKIDVEYLKHFFFDYDGTLAPGTGQRLGDAECRWILQLLKNGKHINIVSNQPFYKTPLVVKGVDRSKTQRLEDQKIQNKREGPIGLVDMVLMRLKEVHAKTYQSSDFSCLQRLGILSSAGSHFYHFDKQGNPIQDHKFSFSYQLDPSLQQAIEEKSMDIAKQYQVNLYRYDTTLLFTGVEKLVEMTQQEMFAKLQTMITALIPHNDSKPTLKLSMKPNKCWLIPLLGDKSRAPNLYALMLESVQGQPLDPKSCLVAGDKMYPGGDDEKMSIKGGFNLFIKDKNHQALSDFMQAKLRSN